MTVYEGLIGLGLMFGLALVFNKLTFENLPGFFVFLTFFNSFVVVSGLLPLWSLILNIVILSIIMYFEINQNRGVN